MKRNVFLFCAVLVFAINFLVAFPVYGSILVETSDTKPSQNIIWHTEPLEPKSNLNWRGPAQRRDVGISFRAAENGTFNVVTISVSNVTISQAISFQFSIYEANEYNEGPLIGREVYSSSGVLPANLTVDFPYLSFILDQDVEIHSGKYYILVFHDFAFTENQTNIVGFVVGDPSANIPVIDSHIWHKDTSEGTLQRLGGKHIEFYIQYENRP